MAQFIVSVRLATGKQSVSVRSSLRSQSATGEKAELLPLIKTKYIQKKKEADALLLLDGVKDMPTVLMKLTVIEL